MYELIDSPWEDAFLDFVRSINHTALIVSPYISAKPLEVLATTVKRPKTTEFRFLTNFNPASMIFGSLNVPAIDEFCRLFPPTVVTHQASLHAKVYIADDHTAIITSGNLTSSSLDGNLEYGVRVKDKRQISEIEMNLREYEQLGNPVSKQQLNVFSELSRKLAETKNLTFTSTQKGLMNSLEQELQGAQESINELRGASGESTNTIFCRTILYILRNGPLPIKQIHMQVQNLHPDLCDDSQDRIINGVHFGRLWKHRVRNAQVQLKRQKQITYIGNKWQLI